jgi:hypothetical protein
LVSTFTPCNKLYTISGVWKRLLTPLMHYSCSSFYGQIWKVTSLDDFIWVHTPAKSRIRLYRWPF